MSWCGQVLRFLSPTPLPVFCVLTVKAVWLATSRSCHHAFLTMKGHVHFQLQVKMNCFPWRCLCTSLLPQRQGQRLMYLGSLVKPGKGRGSPGMDPACHQWWAEEAGDFLSESSVYDLLCGRGYGNTQVGTLLCRGLEVMELWGLWICVSLYRVSIYTTQDQGGRNVIGSTGREVKWKHNLSISPSLSLSVLPPPTSMHVRALLRRCGISWLQSSGYNLIEDEPLFLKLLAVLKQSLHTVLYTFFFRAFL